MALSHLSITDFRNIVQIQLDPLTQGFNFFYGQNGSGKTSFLEAIYYLGHRRSFRSLNAQRLIRYNSNQLSIFSRIIDQNGQTFPLGIERLQQGDFQVRMAGQDVTTISELAYFLPMRFINVHSHHLLENGPLFRRKYLDWGIFYQSKEFHPLWFRFKRALKQRNAALRLKASPKEVASWSDELVETALLFHQQRLVYIEQLLPLLGEILNNDLSGFFDIAGLTIHYQPGWDDSVSYGEILQSSLSKDIERGYTQYGPHKADLSIKFNRISAKDVLSTGQQKLLVCGMLLAQGALLGKRDNKRPIYLIDDLPSELDMRSRRWLIGALASQNAQIFVTAVERETISEILEQIDRPVKMFHVKQGEITEAVEA